MADAVTTRIIKQGPHELTVRLTNRSDGTGETDAVKVDKSTLVGPTPGVEPAALDIKSIRWNMQGITSVQLEFDHATDAAAYQLSGSGYDEPDANTDPLTGDSTGDLLLTTFGAVSGGTYDITIELVKRA